MADCYKAKRVDHSILGLCGLGVILCLYLTSLSLGPAAGDHLCRSLGGDCNGAVNSAHGRIFGFSLASLGLGYFAFQTVLTLSILRGSPALAPALRIRRLLAGGALAASLYCGYLLIFVLPQGCPACYGVHLVNACLFGACTIRPMPGRIFPAAGAFAPLFLAAWMATVIVLGTALAESRNQLADTRKKIEDNLDYYRYRYQISPAHRFEASPADTVEGEPAIALHQIVLFYKFDCSHCKEARKQLSQTVHRHDTAVYLLLKEVGPMDTALLERYGIEGVPAVFIDGRRAKGWQVPGFLTPFVEDCGC